MTDGRNADLTAGRDRVMRHVLARISAAPPRVVPNIIPRSWTMAVLAAALVIIAFSAGQLLTREQRGGPLTVADALGLTPPIARFVNTGTVDPWEFLRLEKSR
jgi:hypothetical protein